MNDNSSPQKSSGKSSPVRLSWGLCILFFVVYFVFIAFFPFTSSVAFFQYFALLFIISVLVSLVGSFFSRKALIPLALLVVFGVICTINYSSFRSAMRDRQAEMEKRLDVCTLKAKSEGGSGKIYRPDMTPGEKERVVLVSSYGKPLLITEKSWRCESMVLSEIQFSDNLHYPEDRFVDGKPGWTGSNTTVGGCYFGLFYELPYPVITRLKGIIRPDGSPQGNLIVINFGIIASSNGTFGWCGFVNEEKAEPGTKTLSFSTELSLFPDKSSRKKSFAGSTWKYVPALERGEAVAGKEGLPGSVAGGK